jgi:hypothetical protein
LGDAEVLVPEMVELQDEGVRLAAVDARPGAEEPDEIGGAFGDQRPFSPYRVRHVALAMQRVVLLFIRGSARAAVVVPLTRCAPAPGKVRDRQEPAAASTGSLRIGGRVRHEHMFALRPDGRGGRPSLESTYHGEWRSLVAHPAGGRAVAGSNPVSPIRSLSEHSREHARKSAKTLRLVVGCSRLFPAVPGTGDRKGTAGESLRSFSPPDQNL